MRVISHTKNFSYLALIYFFNCMPIKKNKIFLFSYYGSQYGCNPKYITDYILSHYPKEKFDLIWAFNNVDSKKNYEGIRKVKTMSLRYFYEICTAKVIITNFRTTHLFKKRKKQYYIQTWHSSLRLKQIEKDAEEKLPSHYVKMAKKDSIKCDLLLSGCSYSTKILKKSFWYEGEIFEYGTPRNDLLIQEDSTRKEKILRKLNMKVGIKILLYAPTFRKHNNTDVYNLNYQQITNQLHKKFGGEWSVLVKLHPHLANISHKIIKGNNIQDVTGYEDVQELLFVADVLISDYSSLMFDFAITDRPCFLYVPDVDEYIKQDRYLYFDLQQLPFIKVTSTDKFIQEINQFDIHKYKREVAKFHNQIGSYEKGYASEKVANKINEICFNKKRRKIDEVV